MRKKREICQIKPQKIGPSRSDRVAREKDCHEYRFGVVDTTIAQVGFNSRSLLNCNEMFFKFTVIQTLWQRTNEGL